MRGLLRALSAILAVCLAFPVQAQDWPTRPVRIVSPFAPGGGSDTVGRIVAEYLSDHLGQQFVVENRGGAGGLIGSAAVAKAAPDGYTFVISSIATHVIAPITAADAGFDPVRDFAHVAFAGGPPTVVVVHPSLGVKSFKELIALLGARSEPSNYVSPGPGTLGNLMAEYWAEKEGIKLTHVAYRGAGQAMSDLVGGHVKIGSLTFTAARGQMRAGTVIPLAVSSSNRMPEFPDVPTLKELGYPELALTTWFAFAAPAGTPEAIVQKMNTEIGNALDSPAVSKRLSEEGFETDKMSPAALTAFIKDQIAKWGPLAKRLIPTEKPK
jgi:tripartite-type tricarboxylate transporter receptor subunit TctC